MSDPSSQNDLPELPDDYWQRLEDRDINALCRRALAIPVAPQALRLSSLNNDVHIDLYAQTLHIKIGDQWEPVTSALIRLLVMVYLLHVSDSPLLGDRISVHDLKDAHFFQGPHELRTEPVRQLPYNSLNQFEIAAAKIGGQSISLADVSYRFLPFPKIPVYYLFWRGDGEFKSRCTVLFDRSIESHLTADAIWGLVRYVSDAIIVNT